jgi:AraC-like DNA-binding protein
LRTFPIAIYYIVEAIMPKLSTALILFAALSFLTANLWLKRRDKLSASPFLGVAALAALQALFVSLRWDYGLAQIRVPQVLLAAALPSAAWLSFRAATSGGSLFAWKNMLHAIPLVLVALALIALPDAIDIVLALTFLIYGGNFLRLALAGDISFDQTALEGVFDMRRALWLLAFIMLGSAIMDVIVYLDFLRVGGQHAAQLIGIGNMIWLLALAVSVLLGSTTSPVTDDDVQDEQPVLPEVGDHKVAEAIQKLLTETGLAKNPGLTLSRLARRAGLPARAVSSAINRVHGRNVSQYINDIRIAEACRLLKQTDASITQAIYASGFQTKSNFNREFLRVTGKTPREWRKALNQAR